MPAASVVPYQTLQTVRESAHAPSGRAKRIEHGPYVVALFLRRLHRLSPRVLTSASVAPRPLESSGEVVEFAKNDRRLGRPAQDTNEVDPPPRNAIARVVRSETFLKASKPGRRQNMLSDWPLRAGCANRHTENDPWGPRPIEECTRESFDSVAHPIEMKRPALGDARGGDEPSLALAQAQAQRDVGSALRRVLRLQGRQRSLDEGDSTRPNGSRHGPIIRSP